MCRDIDKLFLISQCLRFLSRGKLAFFLAMIYLFTDARAVLSLDST